MQDHHTAGKGPSVELGRVKERFVNYEAPEPIFSRRP